MTPAEIALARRIIACGLPVPAYTIANGGICASWEVAPATPAVPLASTWEVELWPGDTCRPFGIAPSAGLLFRCVATNDGPELLPVLDDFALLGWLIHEFRRVADDPCARTIYHCLVEDWWVVDSGGTPYNKARGSTEIEALVAALEAAKAAS